MIRTNNFTMHPIEDKFVLRPVRDFIETFCGMIVINETGKFILDCLETEMTVDELVSRCAENYQCSEDEVRATLSEYLKQLQDNYVISGYSE